MAAHADGRHVQHRGTGPARVLRPRTAAAGYLGSNHRTYDGQRLLPLARINKDNVKGLKLAYAVPLAGSRGREFIEATPLAEDSFLYIKERSNATVLYVFGL
jgi:glucose dehydrogenase